MVFEFSGYFTLSKNFCTLCDQFMKRDSEYTRPDSTPPLVSLGISWGIWSESGDADFSDKSV